MILPKYTQSGLAAVITPGLWSRSLVRSVRRGGGGGGESLTGVDPSKYRFLGIAY